MRGLAFGRFRKTGYDVASEFGFQPPNSVFPIQTRIPQSEFGFGNSSPEITIPSSVFENQTRIAKTEPGFENPDSNSPNRVRFWEFQSGNRNSEFGF